MKSKILRKLCVYAVSASMMLPVAVPVAAAKAPVVSQVKDPFVLHGLNYITAYLYEGDSLQLRSTVPSSKLNRISGSYRWVLFCSERYNFFFLCIKQRFKRHFRIYPAIFQSPAAWPKTFCRTIIINVIMAFIDHFLCISF